MAVISARVIDPGLQAWKGGGTSVSGSRLTTATGSSYRTFMVHLSGGSQVQYGKDGKEC